MGNSLEQIDVDKDYEEEGLILAYQAADQGYDLVVKGLEESGNTVEKLRDLKYLKNFSDEALCTLVDFGENCDYAPDMCNATQTLREDGKIDLKITGNNSNIAFFEYYIG